MLCLQCDCSYNIADPVASHGLAYRYLHACAKIQRSEVDNNLIEPGASLCWKLQLQSQSCRKKADMLLLTSRRQTAWDACCALTCVLIVVAVTYPAPLEP